MLLVDHHEPDVVDRGEHRRARAHAHARLPAAQAQPLVVALPLPQPGVQDRDRVAQARAQPAPPVCGVRAISGTSTIAPCPRASAAAQARR